MVRASDFLVVHPTLYILYYSIYYLFSSNDIQMYDYKVYLIYVHRVEQVDAKTARKIYSLINKSLFH